MHYHVAPPEALSSILSEGILPKRGERTRYMEGVEGPEKVHVGLRQTTAQLMEGLFGTHSDFKEGYILFGLSLKTVPAHLDLHWGDPKEAWVLYRAIAPDEIVSWEYVPR